MNDACRNCPICDTPPEARDEIAELDVNHAYRDQLERSSYRLTYCNCGDLVYLSPLPTDADIHTMYAESEQFGDKDSLNCAYRGDQAEAVLEYTTSCLVSILRSMQLDVSARLKVLEIGAGLSWMCRAAKRLNPQSLTVAQDLSTDVASECSWVDHYFVEDILSKRSVDGHAPYDVVSLTHVIEHLAEPVGMLQRIRQLLATRGRVFITAPYRPENWKRGAEITIWRDWSYNHTPAHIQYFSQGSMEKAAAAAGLEVAHWDHHQDGGQAFECWLRRSVHEK